MASTGGGRSSVDIEKLLSSSLDDLVKQQQKEGGVSGGNRRGWRARRRNGGGNRTSPGAGGSNRVNRPAARGGRGRGGGAGMRGGRRAVAGGGISVPGPKQQLSGKNRSAAQGGRRVNARLRLIRKKNAATDGDVEMGNVASTSASSMNTSLRRRRNRSVIAQRAPRNNRNTAPVARALVSNRGRGILGGRGAMGRGILGGKTQAIIPRTQLYPQPPVSVVRRNGGAPVHQRGQASAVMNMADRELMKKIKIVASLDKVPPPLTVQKNVAIGLPQAHLTSAPQNATARMGTGRVKSLSDRFGM